MVTEWTIESGERGKEATNKDGRWRQKGRKMGILGSWAKLASQDRFQLWAAARIMHQLDLCKDTKLETAISADTKTAPAVLVSPEISFVPLAVLRKSHKQNKGRKGQVSRISQQNKQHEENSSKQRMLPENLGRNNNLPMAEEREEHEEGRRLKWMCSAAMERNAFVGLHQQAVGVNLCSNKLAMSRIKGLAATCSLVY
ncbi:uncharacterized protein BDCG_17245 [Blastomyces dermatitidis ER-3]|uniref:Uncharacterized protein n=1 Tax=Ajellomyces dermatitidis (strain ER-3 / ATCC MYA-2586) TaxID=559297 RepID=A0ABX2VXE5_AJEDR|nr:uncharacterized protein BDCG_17245 [Blastomyces dermatitidis ER-3]OAT01815.1 hypothetical protein BDCG_17245 [Blastomyces dermatitidis ER-3]